MGKLIDIEGLKAYNDIIQAQFAECTKNMVFLESADGSLVTNHSMLELLSGNAFICSYNAVTNTLTPLEPVNIKKGDQTIYLVREYRDDEGVITQYTYGCKEFDTDGTGKYYVVASDPVFTTLNPKVDFSISGEILEIFK